MDNRIEVLIDADSFMYEFGNSTDDQGRPLPWHLVQSRVDARISKIVESTGADIYTLYVTSTDKTNFRFNLATIKDYKGNRPTEKPRLFNQIRDFLLKHRNAVEVRFMEADDAISIRGFYEYVRSLELTAKGSGSIMSPTVVVASRDKDLDMIPGFHYTWACGKQKEKPLWFQSELNGLKCFYSQLLTGDPVDNILGLHGVGKLSALVSRVHSCTTEYSMYELVLEAYTKRFGFYADKFLEENARLLWMLREEFEMWEPPKGGTLCSIDLD